MGLSDQQAVEPASRLLLALMDMYRYIVFKACSVPINVIEHSMRDNGIVLSWIGLHCIVLAGDRDINASVKAYRLSTHAPFLSSHLLSSTKLCLNTFSTSPFYLTYLHTSSSVFLCLVVQ